MVLSLRRSGPFPGPEVVPVGRRVALTMAMGQPRLGDTVCGPVLADTGCAGVRLPASPLGPGPTQPPALGRSRVAFTGLQLPHPPLQVFVLGREVGVRGTGSAFPTNSHRFVGCESQGRMRRKRDSSREKWVPFQAESSSNSPSSHSLGSG